MSLTLIDTNVLALAIRPLRPQSPPHIRRMRAAAAALLATTDVAVSAVSWTEISRIVGPDARHHLDHLELPIIALDRAASMLAADLLHKLRRRQDLCPRCFSATDSAACPGCKRQVSAHQRIADAMIVATAEVDPKVTSICTFDDGMFVFAPLLKTCNIRTPPSQDIVATLPAEPLRP